MHVCVSPLTPLHMHPSLIRHRSELIHASMRGCISVYSHPTKLFIPVCVVQLTARDIPEKYSIFGWEVIILVFLCHLCHLFVFYSQVPEEDIVSVTEMLQAQRKDTSS